MIVFTHLKNNASNYFSVETECKPNPKSPTMLSNEAALFSLFLEYAQGDQCNPETGRFGKAP